MLRPRGMRDDTYLERDAVEYVKQGYSKKAIIGIMVATHPSLRRSTIEHAIDDVDIAQEICDGRY